MKLVRTVLIWLVFIYLIAFIPVIVLAPALVRSLFSTCGLLICTGSLITQLQERRTPNLKVIDPVQDRFYKEALSELDEITERSGLNFIFSFGSKPTGTLNTRTVVGDIVSSVPLIKGSYLQEMNGTFYSDVSPRLAAYASHIVDKVTEGWDRGIYYRRVLVRNNWGSSELDWYNNVVVPQELPQINLEHVKMLNEAKAKSELDKYFIAEDNGEWVEHLKSTGPYVDWEK